MHHCKLTFIRGYLFSRFCLHGHYCGNLFSRTADQDYAKAMYNMSKVYRYFRVGLFSLSLFRENRENKLLAKINCTIFIYIPQGTIFATFIYLTQSSIFRPKAKGLSQEETCTLNHITFSLSTIFLLQSKKMVDSENVM